MKTKDGENIRVSMWVSDQNGIYEITDIGSVWITAKEIIFTADDDPDAWAYGNVHYWLPQEVKKMEYV